MSSDGLIIKVGSVVKNLQTEEVGIVTSIEVDFDCGIQPVCTWIEVSGQIKWLAEAFSARFALVRIVEEV